MPSGALDARRDGFWTPTRQRDGLVVMLTLVTGAVDAIGLTRLGGVFTSVMTGNMVFLGISTAKHDGSIAVHTGVAFIAYVLGSLIGARVAGHAQRDDHLWPRPIVIALALELAVLGVFAIWWEFDLGAPHGVSQYAMLALNAIALGIQSAAVLRFGIGGLSTTYLTGTLTQLIASLTKGRGQMPGRSVLILFALIGGAALGALTAIDAPRAAPLVPLVALATVVGTAHVLFHRRTGR